MKSICSMATGIGIGRPLPGATVICPPGLQQLGQAGPLLQVGGNSRPKVYQNLPENSPTCCVLWINRLILAKLGRKTIDLETMVTVTGLLKLARQSGNVAQPGEYDWMVWRVSIWHMISTQVSRRSDLRFDVMISALLNLLSPYLVGTQKGDRWLIPLV